MAVLKCRRCRQECTRPLEAAPERYRVCSCGMTVTSSQSSRALKSRRGRVRIAVERHKWRWIDLPAQGVAADDDESSSSASSAIVTACSSPHMSVCNVRRHQFSIVCQIVVLIAYVVVVTLVWSNLGSAFEIPSADSESELVP